MVITRLGENLYSVMMDTVMSDGSMRADYALALDGNILKSIQEKGCIRIGGNMRVTLGPKSLPIVQALQIGESAEL